MTNHLRTAALALAIASTVASTTVEVLDGQIRALEAQRARLVAAEVSREQPGPGAGQVLPDFTQCDDAPILSWHVHVNFHANDATNSSFALALRYQFMDAFGIDDDSICEMGHLQPAPDYDSICPFPLEYNEDGPYAGTGPFDLPNFSFFVPPALLHEVMAWWNQHRGTLSVFYHPNSGCQDNDHTIWPAHVGMPTTMNAPHGLACCHTGPPGCTCYVTLYIADDNLCLIGDADEEVVTVTYCDEEDPTGTALWAETNFTNSFHQIEAFGWFPAANRCMAVPDCEAGTPLNMVDCLDEGTANTTLVSYNVGAGALVVDSCPGMCVASGGTNESAVLAACGDSGTAFERRCAMAPHNTPVACPMTQF